MLMQLKKNLKKDNNNELRIKNKFKVIDIEIVNPYGSGSSIKINSTTKAS